MPTSFETSPSSSGLGYTYAYNDDLDIRWGKKNVDKWADADNDGDAQKMLDRRSWAIARAERYINARLANAYYTLPFSAVPDTPREIRDLVVTFAGIYLYQSPRGLVDGEDANEAMTTEKEDAELLIRNINAGLYRISSTIGITAHPEVYPITSIPVQEDIISR